MAIPMHWDAEEVESQFEEPGCLDGCTLLYVLDSSESYEGHVQIIYRNDSDGTLYEVTGGHCSCYGYEDQWQPGEVTVASLRMRNDSDLSELCDYLEEV